MTVCGGVTHCGESLVVDSRCAPALFIRPTYADEVCGLETATR